MTKLFIDAYSRSDPLHDPVPGLGECLLSYSFLLYEQMMVSVADLGVGLVLASGHSVELLQRKQFTNLRHTVNDYIQKKQVPLTFTFNIKRAVLTNSYQSFIPVSSFYDFEN